MSLSFPHIPRRCASKCLLCCVMSVREATLSPYPSPTRGRSDSWVPRATIVSGTPFPAHREGGWGLGFASRRLCLAALADRDDLAVVPFRRPLQQREELAIAGILLRAVGVGDVGSLVGKDDGKVVLVGVR